MSTLIYRGNQGAQRTSKGMRPFTKVFVSFVVLLAVVVGFSYLTVASVTEELTRNALVAKTGNLVISSEAVSPGGMLKMSFKLTCDPGRGTEDTYTFTGSLNDKSFGGRFNFPTKIPLRCIPDIGSESALEKLKEAIFNVIGGPGASQPEQFALRRYVDIVVGVIKSHLTVIGF